MKECAETIPDGGIKFVSLEEQRILSLALRASVRLLSKGRRKPMPSDTVKVYLP